MAEWGLAWREGLPSWVTNCTRTLVGNRTTVGATFPCECGATREQVVANAELTKVKTKKKKKTDRVAEVLPLLNQKLLNKHTGEGHQHIARLPSASSACAVVAPSSSASSTSARSSAPSSSMAPPSATKRPGPDGGGPGGEQSQDKRQRRAEVRPARSSVRSIHRGRRWSRAVCRVPPQRLLSRVAPPHTNLRHHPCPFATPGLVGRERRRGRGRRSRGGRHPAPLRGSDGGPACRGRRDQAASAAARARRSNRCPRSVGHLAHEQSECDLWSEGRA